MPLLYPLPHISSFLQSFFPSCTLLSLPPSLPTPCSPSFPSSFPQTRATYQKLLNMTRTIINVSVSCIVTWQLAILKSNKGLRRTIFLLLCWKERLKGGGGGRRDVEVKESRVWEKDREVMFFDGLTGWSQRLFVSSTPPPWSDRLPLCHCPL